MNPNSQITVLGLGSMGSAIAHGLVDRGYTTTVWNRTAAKSVPLAEAGARVATTAQEAVLASPLVIICLLDSAASDEVLGSLGPEVAGKVVVNLTTCAPEHARANEAWALERGATYVDGKIMGDPRMSVARTSCCCSAAPQTRSRSTGRRSSRWETWPITARTPAWPLWSSWHRSPSVTSS